jgi:GAF domain-containing protein
VVTPQASCGITVRQDSQPLTVASSDARAAHIDEVQYAQGDGPCLQTLRTGQATVVNDFAEERRWGSFASHAVSYGARSSLSLPLLVNGQSQGALNLYSPQQNAFGPEQQRSAEIFAIQASMVLTAILRQTQQVRLTDQLRDALATRSQIDQAIGILMAQQRCDHDAAFNILRDSSQHQNRKLREVAAEIVKDVTGQPPSPPQFNDPA